MHQHDYHTPIAESKSLPIRATATTYYLRRQRNRLLVQPTRHSEADVRVSGVVHHVVPQTDGGCTEVQMCVGLRGRQVCVMEMTSVTAWRVFTDVYPCLGHCSTVPGLSQKSCVNGGIVVDCHRRFL